MAAVFWPSPAPAVKPELVWLELEGAVVDAAPKLKPDPLVPPPNLKVDILLGGKKEKGHPFECIVRETVIHLSRVKFTSLIHSRLIIQGKSFEINQSCQTQNNMQRPNLVEMIIPTSAHF